MITEEAGWQIGSAVSSGCGTEPAPVRPSEDVPAAAPAGTRAGRAVVAAGSRAEGDGAALPRRERPQAQASASCGRAPAAPRPGLAVIAIDGPYHGGRVPAPMTAPAYQQLIADEGIETVTARMTADWLDTVAALAGRGLADDAHVSVFGMSMGARFGLARPLPRSGRVCSAPSSASSASARPRRSTAGCWPPVSWRRPRTPVSAPVLYHVQWDDEIFPRDGQLRAISARWPPPTSN